MQHDIKKVTTKDRYGNQISYEFEAPVKPLDQTAIVKEMMKETADMNGMNIEVPEIEIDGGHPGEPRGSDTVPAWLTPGEFVVNAEAMRIPGAQETVEAINDQGRAIQQEQGGSIPMGYQEGGIIPPSPFLAGPRLNEPQYQDLGGWIKNKINRAGNAVTGDLYNPYVTSEEAEHYGGWRDAKKAKRREIMREAQTDRWQEGRGTPPPPTKPMSARKYIRAGVYNPQYNPRAAEIYREQYKAWTDQYGKPSIWDKLKYRDEGGWITEELLDKLAEVESGSLGTKAVSPAGAIGKYQWLPSSAKQAGYGVEAFDPLDDDAARKATAKYLRNMQKYHGFTPEETLRAYNWGPGNVLKHKKGTRKDIPDEALNYPGKILGFDKVEGVPAPEGMPVPTPRPSRDIPTPTPRPQADSGGGWKDFLNKYVLGEKTQFAAGGGMIPQYYQAGNIVPEIKTGGHAMFGGDQNLGGGIHPLANSPEAIIGQDTNITTDEAPYEPSFWDKYVLGPKTKDERSLTAEDEKFLAEEFKNKIAAAEAKENAANLGIESDIIPTEEMMEDKKITDQGVAEEIVAKPDNKPEEDFKKDIKNKIAIKIDEEAKKDANSTGPGSDQKGPNKTEEEVVNAAESDPSLVEKAGGFLKQAFGELFDGKELARAAILYAGSRALGYNHSGSLQYAAKGYLDRVNAQQTAKVEAAATRDKRAFELAKTDKFTPASVSAYKKSGNPADLVSKKSTAGAVPTGVTEQRLLNGKKTSVQQVKTANGSIAYMLPNGKVVTKATLENNSKPYDASFDKGTSEYRTRRARAVKSNTNLFKEIQGREDAYKKDDETKYNTDIIPSQAAQDFWTFAESYGIDPESDEAQDLMGAAYRQAIAQSNIEGAPRAKNLKPFLEAAYIRQETGAPELFQVNPDKDVKENAKFVRSDKMQVFTSVLDNIAERVLPQATKTDSRNQIIGALVTDWGALPEEDKKQWNARANKGQETGFYLFAKETADNWLIKNKIGE